MTWLWIEQQEMSSTGCRSTKPLTSQNMSSTGTNWPRQTECFFIGNALHDLTWFQSSSFGNTFLIKHKWFFFNYRMNICLYSFILKLVPSVVLTVITGFLIHALYKAEERSARLKVGWQLIKPIELESYKHKTKKSTLPIHLGKTSIEQSTHQ